MLFDNPRVRDFFKSLADSSIGFLVAGSGVQRYFCVLMTVQTGAQSTSLPRNPFTFQEARRGQNEGRTELRQSPPATVDQLLPAVMPATLLKRAARAMPLPVTF